MTNQARVSLAAGRGGGCCQSLAAQILSQSQPGAMPLSLEADGRRMPASTVKGGEKLQHSGFTRGGRAKKPGRCAEGDRRTSSPAGARAKSRRWVVSSRDHGDDAKMDVTRGDINDRPRGGNFRMRLSLCPLISCG